MSRPRLISIDAFAKTVEDAKVKTASGGIITLVCGLIVLMLIRNEYLDYMTIVNRPELVVDKDVNKMLDINVDVSFPNLPCDVFTLDIMDESGDLQLDVLKSGFQKFRIIPGTNQEILDDTPILSNIFSLEEMAKGGQKECGSCYGALPQDNNEYCCNDCGTVRLAYALKRWQFFDGENIAQCEKEGYVSQIKQRINDNEGCRVKGTAKINRISGNMHFAPGLPFASPGVHMHDTSLYEKYKDKFNFDHVINHLSFGAEPETLVDVSEQLTHPLDNYKHITGNKYMVNSYFLKVVATRFQYLDNKPPLETNQFSLIQHHRPLQGGTDDDHQHTIHAKGGLPGVFFHFEISPLKIINSEQYSKTWSGFVLNVVSSISGVLIIGALLDRSVWAAEKVLRGKKDL